MMVLVVSSRHGSLRLPTGTRQRLCQAGFDLPLPAGHVAGHRLHTGRAWLRQPLRRCEPGFSAWFGEGTSVFLVTLGGDYDQLALLSSWGECIHVGGCQEFRPWLLCDSLPLTGLSKGAAAHASCIPAKPKTLLCRLPFCKPSATKIQYVTFFTKLTRRSYTCWVANQGILFTNLGLDCSDSSNVQVCGGLAICLMLTLYAWLRLSTSAEDRSHMSGLVVLFNVIT